MLPCPAISTGCDELSATLADLPPYSLGPLPGVSIPLAVPVDPLLPLKGPLLGGAGVFPPDAVPGASLLGFPSPFVPDGVYRRGSAAQEPGFAPCRSNILGGDPGADRRPDPSPNGSQAYADAHVGANSLVNGPLCIHEADRRPTPAPIHTITVGPG